MVHRIGSRAEERVEKKLKTDVRRVNGKQTLLFRLAEAAVARPEGTIRDVLFPSSANGYCVRWWKIPAPIMAPIPSVTSERRLESL